MQNQVFNPWRYERAQDLKEERLVNDAFRCDRCQMVKPLPFTVQDGGRYCRRCTDMLSPIEANTRRAQDAARASSQPQTSLPLTITGALTGVGSVTSIVPTVIYLARGGASKTVVMTGPNLAAADTFTTDANITITQSLVAGAAGFNGVNTLTISAGASATVGGHDIAYNGDTLQPRGIIQVR